MNKYLEKIAFHNNILGAIGADKGDKIGGGLLGGSVGGALGGGIGAIGGLPGFVIGSSVGGYLGGKAYSRLKDGFRSKAEMANHLKRNGHDTNGIAI